MDITTTRTMPSTVAARRMRALSTAGWLDCPHNSITANLRSVVPTTGFRTAPAGGVGFGAAKQAAPPRGVPR